MGTRGRDAAACPAAGTRLRLEGRGQRGHGEAGEEVSSFHGAHYTATSGLGR